MVRELLGQHGQHAAREVDGGRALARFRIEGRARPHVVAHVRDGDEEPEARAARLGEDRIVEVARVLAVDGDERRRAQVLAPLERRRRHFAPVAARDRERFGRKFVGEAVRGDRELDRRIRAAAVRQHAQHAPDGIAVPARLLGDLDDGEVAMTRGAAGIARHDHALADAPVVRRHESDAALEREAARDLRRAPLEHLDDGALRAAAFVAPGDACRRTVAVKQHAHLAVRQEQVVAAVIRHEEPEAVAVAAHRADDERKPVDEAVFMGAVHEQLAFASHRAEPLQERLARAGFLDAEPGRERVEGERLAGLGEFREQEFAARDRIGVARRLLAKARVFLLPARLAGHRVLEIDMKRMPA